MNSLTICRPTAVGCARFRGRTGLVRNCFEDRYAETVRIRHGVNIAEWDWQSRDSDPDYVYGADPVLISERGLKQVSMFAFEWVSTRPGKVIAEVRLCEADPDYTNHYGPMISENAVILTAISVVNARAAVEVC